MTYTMQPFPTLTDSDGTDLMNAINQIARIRLQDIANQTNANQNTQNIATTDCIACTATGTNTIALQQNANQTVISGYQNYQQFSFVAANNSTGSVTVNVNAIGALNLYKSDGTTQAASGTIAAGALYNITYNSALNSAAGGFQLTSGTAVSVATTSVAGTVIPDGTIITVDGTGHITVPDATSSAFGVVKVDGTTITASSGVISSKPLMTSLGVGSIILAYNSGGAMTAGSNYSASGLHSVTNAGNATGDSLTGTWMALQSTTSTTSSYAVLVQRVA